MASATGPTGKPMMVSEGDPVLVQRVRRADGSVLVNVFNTERPRRRLADPVGADGRGRRRGR